jgi:hypothetical protein
MLSGEIGVGVGVGVSVGVGDGVADGVGVADGAGVDVGAGVGVPIGARLIDATVGCAGAGAGSRSLPQAASVIANTSNSAPTARYRSARPEDNICRFTGAMIPWQRQQFGWDAHQESGSCPGSVVRSLEVGASSSYLNNSLIE